MQHRHQSAGELWASAPWYEQLGMALFLGYHVYFLFRIFIIGH